MKKSHIFLILPVLLSLSVVNSGCVLYSGGAQGQGFKKMIAPIDIPSGGIAGDLLQIFNISAPLKTAIPSTAAAGTEISEVYLHDIAIRTLMPADFHANGSAIESRLLSDEMVGPCAPQQLRITFVKRLELYIQKTNSNQPRVRIATFDNRDNHLNDICGFFMDIVADPSTINSEHPEGTPYNLKNFLPQFTLTSDVEGTPPGTSVKIGGYVAVDWNAPHVILPPR